MAYDLRTLRAPRLAGRALAAFCRTLENPILGAPLVAKFTRDAGLAAFREVELDGLPTMRPPYRDPAEDARSPFQDGDGDGDAKGRPAAGGFQPRSVDDFADAYRDGRATPSAVAERVIEALTAVDRDDPPLRAMIAWRPDDIRAQAEAATARWRAGEPRSELDGVPVAVKDELAQVPYEMTVGTRFLGKRPETVDATVVERLRAAGALLIGKCNMHEIGIGVTGLNVHHGTPRNPHDPGRFTGGSSSGSAAAVAAGLCPVAMGADGGGSIRIPSALCGVVGLKATYGRVSEHGAFALCWSMGHVGPIGATALDCARAYAAVAGPDPGDPLTLGQPSLGDPVAAAQADHVRGLTIGVYRPWFEDASDEVVEACRGALDRLVERGATIKEVTIEHLELCRVAHVVTIASEMAAAMAKYRGAHGRELGLDVRINLSFADRMSSTDYVRAQQARTRVTKHWYDVLDTVDVIATPMTGITAPPIRPDALARGESDLETLARIMRFAAPGNLTGFPAISVPAGHDRGLALPVGLQLIGRPWSEETLLRAAAVVLRDASRQRPRVHHDLLPA